ncbi:MAG: OmpA family protein [Sphingopyxis sp.]
MFPRLASFWLNFIAAALLLTGCQTPQSHGGFTREQTAMLREQGFVESDDGWQLSLADRLLFDIDASTLRPAMAQSIARVSRGLISVSITAARVEGHSDATGTHAHNQTLSLARAQTVAGAMQAHGFSPARLALRGWGETRPIADNGTEAGRSENRRVVIIVTPL